MDVVIGMDIGGTNSDLALVSREGKIIARTHLPTRDYLEFDDFANDIEIKAKLLAEEHNVEIKAFGVGAPNGNFYSGMIEFAPNLSWKGKIKVVEILSHKLGVPTYITNDANAAALGEVIFGVAGELNNFVMITLGTGVGSGVVVNGELVYGHDGFAGEVGHITTTEGGRQCGCGRLGCLETYASVTGLRKSVFDAHNSGHKLGILENVSYDELTGKMIEQAALKGDEVALAAFDIAGRELGKALATVAAINSPEAYVLFGGMANAGPLIFEPVKKHMEKRLLAIYKNKIKIMASGLNMTMPSC